MAIVLYTGVPGAGKTLRSIHDALAKKTEGRPVFHVGIDGMNEEFIPPAPIDSLEEWRKLPPGSILIVDEAHKFLPTRQPGKPPEWIQALTEIRHFGVELWLVTQDPRNVDAFVRRLVGVHYHLTRKAGLAGAMVREFQGVSDDPNDFGNRQSSTQAPWRYPKHLFQVYKSATLHVAKPKIPKKIVFALAALALALFLIPYMIWKFKSQVSSTGLGSATSDQVVALTGSPSKVDEIDPWSSAEAFVEAHTPLLATVPHSAPIYRGLTPKGVPRMLCIASGLEGAKDRRCRCFTEQVTPIHDVHPYVCEAYVKNGVYNPYLDPYTPPSGGASVSSAPMAPVSIQNQQ